MRIEQIRFCNLNSLVGEWVVDFTHPDYAAEGLFAITGPTGAGKSTILDAICLALYGRTPRLGGISASSNEIMSRQTGHCRAEVVFSSRHGKFRCAWHQKRARFKPDGALQSIERQFVAIDNNGTEKVLEERIKKVNEAVEASTGMDFDRFTRSVMLAQGGFAAFLLSEPEQRSRILESLTGTAIYSGISSHIHVRYSEEKRALENLKSRLEGIRLLSEEDEQRLRAEMEAKRQQQAAFGVQLAEVEKGLAWLRGLEQLGEELARLEGQKVALVEQHVAFEPQRLVLRRAEKAQVLRPAFTELTLVEKAQATALQSLEQGNAAEPALRQRVAEAEQRGLLANAEAQSARKAHETALPALREAGKLDALLTEKDSRIQADEKALTVALAAHGALTREHEAHGKELHALHENLSGLRKSMEAHAADKALVESLTGLEERFAHVRRVHIQLEAGQKKQREIAALAEAAVKHLAAQTASVQELQKAEAAARDRLDARQAAIVQNLQGREIAVWREEMTRLAEARNQLLAAQGILARRRAAAEKLVQLQAAAKVLAARRQLCEASITAHEAKLKAQLETLNAAEKEASRFRIMASLAAHRAQLQDGNECPLCGALQHPFAQAVVSEENKMFDERLSREKAAYETFRRELEAFRIQQAESNTGLKENAAQQQEQAALDVSLKAELASRFSASATAVAQSDNQSDDSPTVSERLAATEKSWAEVAELLARVDVDEKCLPSLRTALQSAADKAAQALLAHAACAQSLAALQGDGARLDKENIALFDSLQHLLRNLEAELLPFGEATLTLELLDAVLARLRTRRGHWQGLAESDIRLSQHAAALEARISQEVLRLAGEAQQLQTRREQLQALTAERCSFHKQRLRHFAGQDPAAEEARLAGAVEHSEKARKAAEDALVQTRQALVALQADLVRLRLEMSERGIQLQVLQAAFAAQLHEDGFVDQVDFVAACLPDLDRARLADEERRLHDALTGLEANRSRLAAQLAAQQAEPVTIIALPELAAEQARLAAALTLLHHEFGAQEQALKADAEARIRHASLLGTILQQQASTARWADLNTLIGSADGKKFSKFAQGITFEIMLDHANRQLRVMRDRYLLVRDAAQPLALNVVDSFQAGEVRTTANLSGGESFLVSLALALGLSRMASQNVQVDSLFLDEGFGSLDDDALETALTTISSLREEGKLIGIISHVPSIKERVSTQIKVEPVAGGKSRIRGPGVHLAQ